jgi:uncharacterized protein YgbK (DUF1537 family)
MPQIVMIADDLTGGADAGATFARAGWWTLLALAPAVQCPESEVLIISTESRHLAQEEAAARVRFAAGQIQGERLEREITCVYKKIDSTLRGHPGPELAAVMDVLSLKRALVAPAFPAQGRTTVGGRQLVNEVPVEDTAFGREVHGSDLFALFHSRREGYPARLVELHTVRGGLAAVCEVLDAPGPALVIADAETDADLGVIARAAMMCGVCLLCGSAGLAAALADVLVAQAAPARGPVPDWAGVSGRQPDGPVLVVAGSRHPCTARQVKIVQGRGAVILRPDQGLLRAEAGAVECIIERASEHLAHGQNVVLTTAGLDESPLGEQVVADSLAQVAFGLAAQRLVGGLVLTGGDIAAAVCTALGATTLWLRGEIQPGIPWGVLRGGLLPGLPVTTKAGGFGDDDALAVAITKLVAFAQEEL